MYEGYVCLGGTEIINSMRAQGYAETASQIQNYWEAPNPGRQRILMATNLATNPSFEADAGGVALWENLATNPSFESAGASTVVRRNLIQNSDTNSTTGWTATSGTVASVGGRLQYTQNTVNPVRLGGTTSLSGSKAAGSYVASFRAQTSDASIVGVRVFLYDSVATVVRAQGTIPIIAGGADNKYEFSLTATATFNIVYMEFYGTSIPSGAVGYISQPILESGTATGRPWFNGTTQASPDSDYTTAWTGTAGASESTLSGVNIAAPVAGLVFGSDSLTANIQSGQWFASGAKSWRQVPLGNSRGTYSYINMTGAPFVAGRTYTVIVTFRQSAVQVNPDPTSRRLAYTEANVVVQQAIAANTTAPQELRITFTLGSTGTRLIRFEGAIPLTGTATQSSWWDNLLIVEGAYAGPFFDGANPLPDTDLTTVWSGTANASTSRVNASAVATYTTPSNVAKGFQSTHWWKYGNVSLRQVPTYPARGSAYTEIATSVTPRGLEPGKTYTVLATFYQEVVQPFTGFGNARSIVFIGGTGATVQAPNVIGESPLRMQFTVPETGAWYLRLYNGGMIGDPDSFWDGLLIAEGNYQYDYFDGNFPETDIFEYHWDGLPDRNVSYWYMKGTEATYNNYCDVLWLKDEEECEGLYDALNHEIPEGDRIPWEAQYIQEDAPWGSDSVYEPARKFLGVYGLEISALSDSTRSAEVIQGITDGGVIGRSRNAVPTFRFRVMLSAVDEEGLEYGTAWLSRALAEQMCSSHGPSCGSTDMTFFVACPPPESAFIGPDGREDPTFTWDLMMRQYHDVKCIEGPVVVQEFRRDPNSWGRIVEFTIAAGVPSLYGLTGLTYGDIDQDTSQIITDVPRNAIATPSAELASTDQAVTATNYSLNPSLETNVTGWSGSVTSLSTTTGPLAQFMSASGPLGPRLTIPTHISPPGGQVTHPSVWDFGTAWNGYRYWMGITPYQGGSDAMEDPNIVASTNGTTWVVPAGLTNPLDDQPGSPGPYNSDVNIFYQGTELFCFWRTYNASAAANQKETIYVRRSTNGTTWTAKTIVYQGSRRFLSPTFIFESGNWTMYAIELYNNDASTRMVRGRSNSGLTPTASSWTYTNCTVDPMPVTGRQLWHLEVRWIAAQSAYLALMNDRPNGQAPGGQLYLMRSTDGLNFQRSVLQTVPMSGGADANNSTYKSSFWMSGTNTLDTFYIGWKTGPPSVWNLYRTTVTAPATSPAVSTLFTSGRVTGELAAVGTASMRGRILGNGTDVAAGRARIDLQQDVDISSRPTDSRVSLTVWGAGLQSAGNPGLVSMSATVEWRTATTLISSQSLGETVDPISLGGNVFAARSLVVPEGATLARVIVSLTADWASGPGATNSDVRFYADALAVTVP